MAMSINTNVQSLNAQRNLATSQSSLSTTMQRLSSGLRVNSAKDDAAGLAIAERMNAQVRGMNVAVRNANDGVSMAQTAEGALSKVTDALQRMRELAVQARNGTNGAKDQVSLNKEFVELGKEIDRVIKGADFNGKKILSTDATTDGFTFQVGANTSAQDTIKVTTTNLGTDTDIAAITGASIGNTAAAALDATALATVIGNLDTALDKVNSERAVLGPPEPLRGRGLESASGFREHRFGPQPHHGCRLRFGNRQPEPLADPAAGRYSDGGSGQPTAPGRSGPAALIVRVRRPFQARGGRNFQAPGICLGFLWAKGLAKRVFEG